ncbi:hypothetical protein BHE74_00047558 [Ensete ventricosum]|nr:hypothetical protein BHE74_00047558 [Ensete ventricosum]
MRAVARSICRRFGRRPLRDSCRKVVVCGLGWRYRMRKGSRQLRRAEGGGSGSAGRSRRWPSGGRRASRGRTPPSSSRPSAASAVRLRRERPRPRTTRGAAPSGRRRTGLWRLRRAAGRGGAARSSPAGRSSAGSGRVASGRSPSAPPLSPGRRRPRGASRRPWRRKRGSWAGWSPAAGSCRCRRCWRRCRTTSRRWRCKCGP